MSKYRILLLLACLLVAFSGYCTELGNLVQNAYGEPSSAPQSPIPTKADQQTSCGQLNCWLKVLFVILIGVPIVLVVCLIWGLRHLRSENGEKLTPCFFFLLSFIRQKIVLFAVLFCVIAVLATFAYLVQFFGHPLSHENADWGAFGSYVGGLLTPAFTLLMSALIWDTLTVQQETLRLQKEAQDKSEKDQQQQKFGDLLELYQGVVIRANSDSPLFWNTFWDSSSPDYQTFYNTHQVGIRDYLRIILVILKFLKKSPDEMKTEYASRFCTMLCNNEKGLLRHHCLCFATEDGELCKLVNEFSLTKGWIQPPASP